MNNYELILSRLILAICAFNLTFGSAYLIITLLDWIWK